MFEKTEVPKGFQKHYIEWIEPISDNEPLSQYIIRLKDQIMHPYPLFAGLSFGGVIALELSKEYQSDKVMLISSFRNKEDLTFPIRILLRTKAYKIIPDIDLNLVRRIMRQAYAVRSGVAINKIIEMMGDHSPRYLRWSVRMIDEYQHNTSNKAQIHSIIGNKDRLVKVWDDHPIQIIKGGTHIAVYKHANKVNEIIAEILLGND